MVLINDCLEQETSGRTDLQRILHNDLAHPFGVELEEFRV